MDYWERFNLIVSGEYEIKIDCSNDTVTLRGEINKNVLVQNFTQNEKDHRQILIYFFESHK